MTRSALVSLDQLKHGGAAVVIGAKSRPCTSKQAQYNAGAGAQEQAIISGALTSIPRGRLNGLDRLGQIKARGQTWLKIGPLGLPVRGKWSSGRSTLWPVTSRSPTTRKHSLRSTIPSRLSVGHHSAHSPIAAQDRPSPAAAHPRRESSVLHHSVFR